MGWAGQTRSALRERDDLRARRGRYGQRAGLSKVSVIRLPSSLKATSVM